MMKAKTPGRLWRAEWIHINGYHAPSYFVETTIKDYDKAKKEAIKKAKERSRLADFPKSWSVRITFLPDKDPYAYKEE